MKILVACEESQTVTNTELERIVMETTGPLRQAAIETLLAADPEWAEWLDMLESEPDALHP